MTISIYGTSIDAQDAIAIAAFWAEALGRRVADGSTPERASLDVRDVTTDTPITFHRVAESKSAKNRVHLDLITGQFEQELERLTALGAEQVASFERWVTLRDPEGNEFDLIRGDSH
jgi:hypothetical protein